MCGGIASRANACSRAGYCHYLGRHSVSTLGATPPQRASLARNPGIVGTTSAACLSVSRPRPLPPTRASFDRFSNQAEPSRTSLELRVPPIQRRSPLIY